MNRSRRCVYAACVFVVAILGVETANAQEVGRPLPGRWSPVPGAGSERVEGHLLTLSANALIGGLTAGALQGFRGGSFKDAFVRGALGGAGVYAGKVISVSRSPGAGLLGRQVAAIGASVSRNAAEGRPALERVVLPVGPAYVRMDFSGGVRGNVTLDVLALGTLGVLALSDYPASVDWASTLSSGAFVFEVEDETGPREWAARHLAGAILVRREGAPGVVSRAASLAHERVHVLQYDQSFILWGDPAERAFFSRLPYQQVTSRVSLSLQSVATMGLGFVIPYHQQPWEVEAHFLAETDRGGSPHRRR